MAIIGTTSLQLQADTTQFIKALKRAEKAVKELGAALQHLQSVKIPIMTVEQTDAEEELR